MRILELFSGTKSVSKTMLEVWPDAQVVSVDVDPTYNTDICTDIATWDFSHFDVGHFDVVWASPPCTQYSKANQGGRDLDTADALVMKTFQIIEYLMPSAWFVENPASGLLPRRPFMTPFAPYKCTTSYCMFGTRYKKDTHVWTNLDVRLPRCSPGTPCPHFAFNGYHAETAQKGPSRVKRHGGFVQGHPTHVLWQVPRGLVLALCQAAHPALR